MALRKRHLRTVVADGTCDASEPALAIQWENDNPDLLPHSHLIVAQACKLAEDDPTLANDPAEALRQATETFREIAAEVRPPASNSRLGALIILTALLFLFAFALGLLSSRHLENFIPADPIETHAVSLPSAEFAPPERLRTAGVRIVRKSATETFDQPTVALQVGAYESRAIAEQWAQVLSPRYQHAALVAPARVHDNDLVCQAKLRGTNVSGVTVSKACGFSTPQISDAIPEESVTCSLILGIPFGGLLIPETSARTLC